MTWRRAAVVVMAGVLAASVGSGRAGVAAQAANTAFVGAQDPAWSPDGTRVAVSALDAIWTMAADGKQAAPVVTGATPGVERDPVFSPDGGRVAFAADRGAGFDIYVAGLRDRAVTPVTTQPGDERWPSFTPDGRIVFASRAPRHGRVGADPGAQWDLQIVQPAAGSPAWQTPLPLTDTLDNETYPRVSPDGALVAFISERDADDDVDLWVMPAPAATATLVALGACVAPSTTDAARPPRPTRVVRVAGIESHLAWAPDSTRLAFHGVRAGVGAVWVATVDLPQTEGARAPRARPKPAAPPVLVSRRAGAPAWSPAGRTLLVTGVSEPEPTYNGNPTVNKDYAETLRAIARDGADTFYRGAIARQIAADMAGSGGLITYADLAQYRATSDANYWHPVIEAWKVRDPLRRVADPERWPVDFAEHLQPDHAARLFRQIDPAKASTYERQGDDDGSFTPPATRIGRGTTAFAVGDAEGNLIAVTQTLSTWGGTFYVSKGLGFLYNHHLRSSRPTPGAYGSLVPLMRSTTGTVPTLVFAETEGGLVPRLAVGCAGNAWIPLTVYTVITSVIDGGLGAQAAIEAPRFLPGRDPADPLEHGARIEIEDRFPRPVLDDLQRRGHRFQKIGRKGEVRYGYASAVLVDMAAGTIEGGAEPRRSHAAVAAGRASASSQP